MQDNKYNGWTNYATWRVNLEMFDGNSLGLEDCDPDAFKEIAIEVIEQSCDVSGLAFDYAMAFLDTVNWHEIAEHYKSEVSA